MPFPLRVFIILSEVEKVHGQSKLMMIKEALHEESSGVIVFDDVATRKSSNKRTFF